MGLNLEALQRELFLLAQEKEKLFVWKLYENFSNLTKFQEKNQTENDIFDEPIKIVFYPL